MTRFLLCLGALLLSVLPFAGCLSVKRGDTILHVEAADREEEKTLRRQLWRVQRAVSDVRIRYGLEDQTIEVVVATLGGLGETTPAIDGLRVSGAKFIVNKQLFLQEHPDLDEILLGLTAHELAHALHYSRMSDEDLIELGITYGAMMKHPDGPEREWVRAYEQLTDMTAIALGYGEYLVHQKTASEANLAANHPDHVWDFYLKEHEILEFMRDREELRRRMQAALDTLSLPSLRRFMEHPAIDADGDLVSPSPGQRSAGTQPPVARADHLSK